MQTATPAARKAPRPRADALRNRERIVTAAREMFVEHGPDVPLDDIARRAGVGNATVYRNFPDRDALVREVVCSVMDRTVAAVCTKRSRASKASPVCASGARSSSRRSWTARRRRGSSGPTWTSATS